MLGLLGLVLALVPAVPGKKLMVCLLLLGRVGEHVGPAVHFRLESLCHCNQSTIITEHTKTQTLWMAGADSPSDTL